MPEPDSNPASDPLAFAKFVKHASVDELKQLMRGPQRELILTEIFTRMPDVFRPDRAGPLEATIHWKVGDRDDGAADTFQLVVGNGACEFSESAEGKPRVVLSIGVVDFLKVVTGNANPVALFMRGRMKAKGDLGLAMKIPGLFDPPRA